MEHHSYAPLLAAHLIRCGGGPDGAKEAQSLIGRELETLGFEIETIIGPNQIHNLWACTEGAGPIVAFAGHTDVVDPGPLDQWDSPPFEPTIRVGQLYGRGAADMRGGIASIISALRSMATRDLPFRIGVVIAGDEESDARGTEAVLGSLCARGERITHCIVAEPSCEHVIGDTVRVGRRGSVTGSLVVRGIQGHVAYGERSTNPIDLALPCLLTLSKLEWHAGDDVWPATSLQITNVRSGTGETNVIPGTLEAMWNVRHSVYHTREAIIARIEEVFAPLGARAELTWKRGASPFVTSDGVLRQSLCAAVQKVTGHAPAPSTGGGTSDARFFAAHGVEVVEFGPLHRTIHQVNECVAERDLVVLSQVFAQVLAEIALRYRPSLG